MWRRNTAGFGNDARENDDSDQSISEEEEDLDGEGQRNTVTLGGLEHDKGKMQVLSQLEILRESCEHSTKESISSHGKREGCHIKDEFETPIYSHRNSSSHNNGITSTTHANSNEGLIHLPHVASELCSSEEIISDDEKINPHTFRSGSDNLAITWFEASREVEALIRSNEKPSSSSNHHVKEKQSIRGRGGRKKAKAKFSFPGHSDKTDLHLVVNDSNEETSSDNIAIADEIGGVADDEMDDYMADSHLNGHDNQLVPFEMARKHNKEHSMAEILSGYMEKSDLQNENPELRIASPLVDSIQEDDDLPEALDSDTSFENEDEFYQGNAQRVNPVFSKTVADQFHDAFRTVSAIDDGVDAAFPRPLCGGLYKKLQQVLQIEKDRDLYSLKNASGETGFKDEVTSISVRILSRSLEAKLIVCLCVRDGKNSSRENDFDMEMRGITNTMTIIFNPRMRSDVDIEIGHRIHIHHPWKEVKVKDEVIFLCSHFSQVNP